jgi:hypothetical protein
MHHPSPARQDVLTAPAVRQIQARYNDTAAANAQAERFSARTQSVAFRTATTRAPAPRIDPMRLDVRPPIA